MGTARVIQRLILLARQQPGPQPNSECLGVEEGTAQEGQLPHPPHSQLAADDPNTVDTEDDG
jgi:hypothetical protein